VIGPQVSPSRNQKTKPKAITEATKESKIIFTAEDAEVAGKILVLAKSCAK